MCPLPQHCPSSHHSYSFHTYVPSCLTDNNTSTPSLPTCFFNDSISLFYNSGSGVGSSNLLPNIVKLFVRSYICKSLELLSFTNRKRIECS
ncbi:hypothetical protein Mapa_012727 [Marchantia paleacea]|nr:hypothetical protein Mapa_012727 [Marchantia paleacea]